MVSLTTPTSLPDHQRSSNYDEISMQESLRFAASLKDLKNLRTQLYSAAEYFELSYMNDGQNKLVIDTLKEYTIKALVSTVDHLGSVTFKVNGLLDKTVEEVSTTGLRISCIEQRLITCHEYADNEGMVQQSSIVDSPKYNKRYVLPAGQTMDSNNLANLKRRDCGIDEDDWFQFRSAVKATIRDTPSKIRDTPSTFKKSASFVRRGRSISPSPISKSPGSFSFSGSILKNDKQSVLPHQYPLQRSGSVALRTTTPTSKSNRPNPAYERQPYLPGSWKSASMRVHDEKEKPKDIERYPSKSKGLLKALLSRRKSKKDDMLYTYLDEY